MSSDRLIPLPEVAERLGRSLGTLQAWAREEPPRFPVEKMGRGWFVRESDLPLIDALPRRRREPVRIHAEDGGTMVQLATVARDPSRPDWSAVRYRCEACGYTEDDEGDYDR